MDAPVFNHVDMETARELAVRDARCEPAFLDDAVRRAVAERVAPGTSVERIRIVEIDPEPDRLDMVVYAELRVGDVPCTLDGETYGTLCFGATAAGDWTVAGVFG